MSSPKSIQGQEQTSTLPISDATESIAANPVESSCSCEATTASSLRAETLAQDCQNPPPDASAKPTLEPESDEGESHERYGHAGTVDGALRAASTADITTATSQVSSVGHMNTGTTPAGPDDTGGGREDTKAGVLRTKALALDSKKLAVGIPAAPKELSNKALEHDSKLAVAIPAAPKELLCDSKLVKGVPTRAALHPSSPAAASPSAVARLPTQVSGTEVDPFLRKAATQAARDLPNPFSDDRIIRDIIPLPSVASQRRDDPSLPGAHRVSFTSQRSALLESSADGGPMEDHHDHDSVHAIMSQFSNTELVTAELVAPPVEAIVVGPMADLEGGLGQLRQESNLSLMTASGHHSIDSCSQNRRPSSETASMTSNESHSPSWFGKTHMLILHCFIVALLVTLVVALAVSLADSNDAPFSDSATSPHPFPYQCHSTTKSLIQAQHDFPHQGLFIICPGTHVKVGILDTPEPGAVRFKNGQDPLIILKEDTEVRCGLDGSASNNCVLDGGQMQVLLHDDLYENEYGVESRPTNNVTIRGMTFTGEMHSDQLWGSASVVISNPGAKNVRFVDCKWDSLDLPSNLIYVGLNSFQWMQGVQWLPADSMDVSIINSSFTNITYQSTLLRVINQTLSVEGATFRDIKLPSYIRDCSFSQDYCLGLMYCYEEAHCSLQDISVDNLDFFGSAALLGASNNTEWHVSGMRTRGTLRLHPHSPASSIVGGVCDSGVAQYDASFKTVKCWEPEADIKHGFS